MRVVELIQSVQDLGGLMTVGKAVEVAERQYIAAVNILHPATNNGMVRRMEQCKITVSESGTENEEATFWTLPQLFTPPKNDTGPTPVDTDEAMLSVIEQKYAVGVINHTIQHTEKGSFVSAVYHSSDEKFRAKTYFVTKDDKGQLVAYEQTDTPV